MGLILVEVLLTTSEKLKVLYIVCSLYGVDTLLLPRSSQIAFHFNNFNIVPRIVILISIQFIFFPQHQQDLQRGENTTICAIWNGGGKAGVSSACGFTPGPLRRVEESCTIVGTETCNVVCVKRGDSISKQVGRM